MDFSLKFINNWTPLHFAAGNGFLNIVKILLEYGANINVMSSFQFFFFFFFLIIFII